MSKYIEIDTALLKTVATGGISAKALWKRIMQQPSIDIVNCIECAYLGEDWWCYKHEFTPIPIEDYFCKDGERKDYE